MNHGYMYVFIRTDLPLPQIAVQSCHSSVEASRHFLKPDDEHPSIIILQVENESQLDNVSLYLSGQNVKFIEFREPDRNNELTSIASNIVYGEDRQIFRRFPLLKGELH